MNTETPTNLASLIRMRLGLASAESVTQDTIDAILSMQRDEASVILWSVVRDEVRRLERNDTRTAETNWADSLEPGTAIDPLLARKTLLSTSFLCPGHGMVGWGEATAEQHHLYATQCRGQAHSLISTAERHERAARMIEDAGVECLADLEAVTA